MSMILPPKELIGKITFGSGSVVLKDKVQISDKENYDRISFSEYCLLRLIALVKYSAYEELSKGAEAYGIKYYSGTN